MAIQHTQGKWSVKYIPDYQDSEFDTICHIESDDKPGDGDTWLIAQVHIPTPYKGCKEEAQANAALICDAVNNTAGAGIDPKSVPFMLQACKNALADLAGIMPEYEPDGDRNHSAWTTINELSQAITDAQIK